MDLDHSSVATTAAGDSKPDITSPREVLDLTEQPAWFVDAISRPVPVTARTGVLHLSGDRHRIHVEPADQRTPPFVGRPGGALRRDEPVYPATWPVSDDLVGPTAAGSAC